MKTSGVASTKPCYSWWTMLLWTQGTVSRFGIACPSHCAPLCMLLVSFCLKQHLLTSLNEGLSYCWTFSPSPLNSSLTFISFFLSQATTTHFISSINFHFMMRCNKLNQVQKPNFSGYLIISAIVSEEAWAITTCIPSTQYFFRKPSLKLLAQTMPQKTCLAEM